MNYCSIMDRTTYKVDRFTLKLIAIGCMFLNHFATVFVPSTSFFYSCCMFIGRFTAITMSYLLAEGFYRTSSIKKYMARLLIFAFASQLPFVFLIGQSTLNVLFTLFMSSAILLVKKRFGLYYAIVALTPCLILFPFFDWGGLLPLSTLLFSLCNSTRNKTIVSVICSIYYVLLLILFSSNISGASDIVTVFVSLLIPCLFCTYIYNGQKGNHSAFISKWLFYVFYPGHMILLLLINWLLTV